MKEKVAVWRFTHGDQGACELEAVVERRIHLGRAYYGLIWAAHYPIERHDYRWIEYHGRRYPVRKIDSENCSQGDYDTGARWRLMLAKEGTHGQRG